MKKEMVMIILVNIELIILTFVGYLVFKQPYSIIPIAASCMIGGFLIGITVGLFEASRIFKPK